MTFSRSAHIPVLLFQYIRRSSTSLRCCSRSQTCSPVSPTVASHPRDPLHVFKTLFHISDILFQNIQTLIHFLQMLTDSRISSFTRRELCFQALRQHWEIADKSYLVRSLCSHSLQSSCCSVPVYKGISIPQSLKIQKRQFFINYPLQRSFCRCSTYHLHRLRSPSPRDRSLLFGYVRGAGE